jgi:hypothetical protein
MSSGQHMNVQMANRLAAIGAGVYDEPKPAFVFCAKNRGGFHQGGYFVGRTFKCVFRDIGHVPFRQHQ